MKVLTLSFTWDFSRFFNQIFSADSVDSSETSLYNISLYPSAHYYWKKNGHHSVLLPFVFRDIGRESDECVDEELLLNWVYFNQKSLCLYGRNEYERLLRQARKYYFFYKKLFAENAFDLVLCAGDSRLAVEVLKYFAKITQTRVLFFEQGPFRTTILDERGVNANSSFKDIEALKRADKEWLQDFFVRLNLRKAKTIWKNKLPLPKWIRMLDLVCMYPPALFRRLMPVDVQLGQHLLEYFRAVKRRRKTSVQVKESVGYAEKKIVLFALQVPVDAQFILHSPIYDSFVDMLNDVLDALPPNYLLVVREHPFYQGRYDARLYERINANENCLLDNDVSLSELIEMSDLVIVNNSTTGLDALGRHKKVLLLGDAYYKKDGVVYSINCREELRGVLREALDSDVNYQQIDDLLYTLMHDYLIEGHFQDDCEIHEEILARIFK